MVSTFWRPGCRCRVQRTLTRTVVDVTVHETHPSGCCVKIQWQSCDKRGLAAAPLLDICSGQISLVSVMSERIREGRLILPSISDDIWPQCYLKICTGCPNCAAVPDVDGEAGFGGVEFRK